VTELEQQVRELQAALARLEAEHIAALSG